MIPVGVCPVQMSLKPAASLNTAGRRRKKKSPGHHHEDDVRLRPRGPGSPIDRRQRGEKSGAALMQDAGCRHPRCEK